ncbi:MAG: GntR family transcriptional regulator [Acidimicrobiales bacterium]|jgi:GntR family transcriptional regulator
MESEPTIEFRLDRRSGVPAYRQLVDQVRHALRLGLLQPGDRLPTVRDVVRQIAINPNTVHRAFRELEQQGLTEGRPGSGTFVVASLSDAPEQQSQLQDDLQRWMEAARAAGLGDEAISALVADAMRASEQTSQRAPQRAADKEVPR